jgi:hypothetical protein
MGSPQAMAYPPPYHHTQNAPGSGPPVPAPPMMLDVIVRYQYCGHRGKKHIPTVMQGRERRLRITIDENRTSGAIRHEVCLRKDILPSPYQLLGGTCYSQTGFELGDEDLVRYIAARGEFVTVTLDYRKDATKGYHVEKGACVIM